MSVDFTIFRAIPATRAKTVGKFYNCFNRLWKRFRKPLIFNNAVDWHENCMAEEPSHIGGREHMVENGKNEVGQRTADVEETQRNRRNFLKKAAKAATIAPAVTLLMSANTRPALASHVH